MNGFGHKGFDNGLEGGDGALAFRNNHATASFGLQGIEADAATVVASVFELAKTLENVDKNVFEFLVGEKVQKPEDPAHWSLSQLKRKRLLTGRVTNFSMNHETVFERIFHWQLIGKEKSN
jgi:hypothetical protein